MTPDFDELYESRGDPWQVETSWYERRKLAILLASLPNERYGAGWEPGCGLGVTTERLAGRCDQLVATDGSGVAVRRTQARCARLPHVSVEQQSLPATPAARAPFDLVIAAEFLYYLPDLAESVAALWQTTRPGGHLVVLHWRHDPHDGSMSGAALHATIEADAESRGARRLVAHNDDDFVLDVYEAP
jgi:trans-aconitate methyltransferase